MARIGDVADPRAPVLFVIGKWYGFRPGNPPSNHFRNLVGSLESTGLAPHALLVENPNPHTDRWFVPGVHYAPWRDLDELVTTVRHHLQHETQRQLLARRGRHLVTTRYTAAAYWRELLEFADGAPSDPPPMRRRDAPALR